MTIPSRETLLHLLYKAHIEEVDGKDGSTFLACVACADLSGELIVGYRWARGCLDMDLGVRAAMEHLEAEHYQGFVLAWDVLGAAVPARMGGGGGH